MSKYCDIYGIPGDEVANLRRRWDRIKRDNTWGSFDDFLLWCSEQEYRTRMVLVKRIKSMPHGPKNSSFRELSEVMREIRKESPKRTEISVESPFCYGCKKKCPAGGCAEWRKWYQENWDDNIHQNIPKKTVVGFRYEHPDMVREGLVWRG